MHRLPQYHRGNPRVGCQNTYQVNQYDTSLSPQVFMPQDIHHVFSYLNKDSIHHNKGIEGRNIIWSDYINKAHDIDHERERERLITKLLVQTLNPEGGLLPPNVVAAGDDSPPLRCQNGSRLVFGGYGALGQRNFWSRLTPKSFGIFGNL